MATSNSFGMEPAGMMSFIFRIMCAMCLGLFSSRCSMSRSISAIARAMRGSSKSGMGGSPPADSSLAGFSFKPLVMAKRLTCLASFFWPHWGQAGAWPGFTRLARKLKIFRHLGQANS